MEEEKQKENVENEESGQEEEINNALNDDEDDCCYYDTTVQEIYHSQPYETTIKVTDKLNSKQEHQPEVSVYITRRHETSDEILKIIDMDINNAVEKAKNAVKRLIEI